MKRGVHVSAPSRLHFGMFSFGQTETPQFGGVGIMLDKPRVDLSIYPAAEFRAKGPLSARSCDIASGVWPVIQSLTNPVGLSVACEIEIHSAPPEHAGLGVGTQLTLAITAGLLKLANLPMPAPAAFATLAGRGLRSAVGTYGFLHGGMIVEAGKGPGETLSPLVSQLSLPPEWRFVLMLSPRETTSAAGLSGEREVAAFANLPPVSSEATGALCKEALLHLVPAARTADFQRFSAALYRYGKLAGECFASCQGGPFASPALGKLVETVRALGVEGVGQSSWGPTLFALVDGTSSATTLIEQLSREPAASGVEFQVSAPAESGASIEWMTEQDK